MPLDLPLLGRWLTGWSLARGLPLPQPAEGGLVVEVGWPEQVRRYVFVEAGEALQDCVALSHDPYTHVKATVEPAQLQRVLPPGWQLDQPRYLMSAPPGRAPAVSQPPGYLLQATTEQGALVHRVLAATGQLAASGRVVLHQGTAVFDRIETQPAHRLQGLATYLMGTLEALVQEAGMAERLLVATEAGRPLYQRLGWRPIPRPCYCHACQLTRANLGAARTPDLQQQRTGGGRSCCGGGWRRNPDYGLGEDPHTARNPFGEGDKKLRKVAQQTSHSRSGGR